MLSLSVFFTILKTLNRNYCGQTSGLWFGTSICLTAMLTIKLCPQKKE